MERSIFKPQVYLFNIIIIWSIITSLFTWLPLVRIIGKPNEYYWGILGMSGEGIHGPYWIFILGFCLVIFLFYSVFRIRLRIYSYATLLLWHLLILYLVVKGFIVSNDTTIQGQGLHWEFPIWFLIFPALLSTICVFIWIILEIKNEPHFKITSWKKQNSKKFLGSIGLLFLAIYLFSIGDNYNWVTSTAIVATIFQWLLFVESFKPIN